MRRFVLPLLLVAFVGSVWGAGETESSRPAFPTRTIEVYVGFAAGGGTDILARQLARNMEPVLGQSLVIVNQGGGGGLVALKTMAARRPDGYTLGVLLGNQFLQKHHRGSETWIDPLEEVTLLGVFNQDPWGIAVRADAPFSTIQEFIAYARANPGMRVGAGAPGTLYYWTWQALMDTTGIELTIVPFGGTALALTALAGGELSAAGAGPPEADSLMSAGLLKMIGVASMERLPAYPDIPTFPETGFDMVIGPWRAIVGPRGMSEDVVNTLSDAVRVAYESEPFQTFIREQGFGEFYLDPVAGKRFFEEQDEFFRSLMERRGELRGQ